jgi:hypothetical protein
MEQLHYQAQQEREMQAYAAAKQAQYDSRQGLGFGAAAIAPAPEQKVMLSHLLDAQTELLDTLARAISDFEGRISFVLEEANQTCENTHMKGHSVPHLDSMQIRNEQIGSLINYVRDIYSRVRV